MSKEHTPYLGDSYCWMMPNPGKVNGFVTINHIDNESIQMLQMQYIHYIDVKSNEQLQQDNSDIIISQRIPDLSYNDMFIIRCYT